VDVLEIIKDLVEIVVLLLTVAKLKQELTKKPKSKRKGRK
jgi:hypothetical protein